MSYEEGSKTSKIFDDLSKSPDLKGEIEVIGRLFFKNNVWATLYRWEGSGGVGILTRGVKTLDLEVSGGTRFNRPEIKVLHGICTSLSHADDLEVNMKIFRAAKMAS